MSSLLPPGYQFRTGSGLDRAILVKFMQRTYKELYPEKDFSHLVKTVEHYFSRETPLLWVEEAQDQETSGVEGSIPSYPIPHALSPIQNRAIACLWIGTAVDQVKGDRHSHIFLLYVAPEHRRKGIGKVLMHHAEGWARARGDRQISLQVFQDNQPAVNLYHQLGYQTQSFWMVKFLDSKPSG